MNVTEEKKRIEEEKAAKAAAEAAKPKGIREEYARAVKAAEQPAKAILRNKGFQYVSLIALMLALYMPDFWIVANVPSNLGLDVILALCMFMFLLEIFVQLLGRRGGRFLF